MTDQALFGAPAGGLVGNRALVAVQTVDLGRLTHHPVPLVPSALIAVSGTGPHRDSNGSGKTTFLAALALLLGDPEWRVASSGGSDALGLLFDPDLSGDSAGLYDPARVGYVVGVFARCTADGHYDELTVWVRISTDDSPRLCARWAPGVHLVPERDQAASTWHALGRERQIGPTSLVEQLYGGTGRCLAYVTSRGSRDTDSSLLQLQARLSPARIGNELIVLLGLEHLIDGERELRSKLSKAQHRLAERIEEHERREQEWAATLTAIDARDRARTALQEGHRLWRLRTARKLLDVLAEQQRLDADLATLATNLRDAARAVQAASVAVEQLPDTAALEQALEVADQAHASSDQRRKECSSSVARREVELEELARRIAMLTEAAIAAPPGLTTAAADEQAVSAAEVLDRAVRSLGSAEAEVAASQRLLATVTEHGEVDPTAQAALAAANVPVVPLVDRIVLDDEARDRWEPLLVPWRSALVVAAGERGRAVAAVPPGTTLVVADESVPRQLPIGVAEAPEGTERFLDVLASRAYNGFVDEAAGVVVTGGFEQELCG